MPSADIFRIVRYLRREGVCWNAGDYLPHTFVGDEICVHPPTIDSEIQDYLGCYQFKNDTNKSSYLSTLKSHHRFDFYVPLKPEQTSNIPRGMSLERLLNLNLLTRPSKIIEEGLADMFDEELFIDMHTDLQPDPIYLWLYGIADIPQENHRLPLPDEFVIRITMAMVTNIQDLSLFFALHG